MLPIDEIEGSKTSASMHSVVVSELHSGQKGRPVVKVVRDEGAEHVFNGTVVTLGLTICLWVVGCREVELSAGEVKQLLPKITSKAGITI